MTAPDLAAALLKDVPRYTFDTNGELLYKREVLAALTAALDPAIAERAGEVLEGVTPGRVVQFHPHFCEEAKDASFKEWDTSHDLSVITPNGDRYRIGSMRHADDAAFFQWCHANLPALLAQNAALRAERDALIEWNGQASVRAESAEDRAEAAEAKVEKLRTERDEWRKLESAAQGLSEVLDQHETKGPLPDTVLMFCWLAAQNVRAVLRGYMLENPE